PRHRPSGGSGGARVCEADRKTPELGVLSAGQTAPEPYRDLFGGVHGVCGGFQEVAGGQCLRRGNRSRHCTFPAADRAGHRSGVLRTLTPEGAPDLRKFPRDQRERLLTAVSKGKNSMPPWGDLLKA